MRRLLLVSAWILVTAAGGLLGRWVGESRAAAPVEESGGGVASSQAAAPSTPPAVLGRAPAVPGRAPTVAASLAADPALVACKAALATCAVATAKVREGSEGVEVPWNDSVPDDERPDAVKAGLQRVKKDCPAFEGRPTYVDCDEFPCLVWTEARTKMGTLTPSDVPELRSCPDWPFSVYSTMVGQPGSSGENITLQAVPATSADTLHGDLGKRIQFRVKSGQSVAEQALEESQ